MKTNATSLGTYGCLAATALALLPGCTKPSAANIGLRKENQELRQRLDRLEALERAGALSSHATTRVGEAELAKLYVTSGLSFGRLTSVEGRLLRVFVTPTDQAGDSIKAAGAVRIWAFDLTKGKDALVGEWAFTPDQAARAWNGKGLLYGYVLECPLEAEVKPGGKLRLRVEFTDLLTGKPVSGETEVGVR